MKSFIALIALSLVSVSCVNLEGTLNVEQMLSAKKRGGFLNLQMKSVQIQPGAYHASLKVNNAKSFTLKLKADKEGEADILIPLKSEKDFVVPTNGNVIIRGSEISQPFDVSGKIATNVTFSDTVRSTEVCTMQRTENRCEKICSAPVQPYGTVTCNIVCHDEVVTWEGSRFVEYHNKYTERNLSAELLDSESKAVRATFSGTDYDSSRVYDYYGECR
jgi:hypothetical protein